TSGPNLLIVGRLRKEKGADLLLDAMPILLPKIPGAHLTILGTGPDMERLKRQAEKLGLNGKIDFLGFIKNPWPYLAQADLFVLPSRVEGLPNSLLEAVALNVSAVATDCSGGVREIQKLARHVILVPPDDPASLADAIVTALSKPKGKDNGSKITESLHLFDP